MKFNLHGYILHEPVSSLSLTIQFTPPTESLYCEFTIYSFRHFFILKQYYPQLPFKKY